jgi:hypothetical protein
MSTPWMKKGRKCAFAKKKGVEFIIHLVSKSSSKFSLISINLTTTIVQVNQSCLLNNVFLNFFKTQLLQYAFMLGNLCMMSTPWMKNGRKCAFAQEEMD